MLYHKLINGQDKISSCESLYIDGCWVSNPTEEMILADGWEIYSPPTPVYSPRTEPDEIDLLVAIKKMLQSSTSQLSDEEALEVAALYPTWASKIGYEVSVGERLWYDGKLYKVVQAHTVQEDWTPDVTASLYTEVSIDEWPAWKQPLGSEDAYNTGDKVSHNDKHWVSIIDGNVWEPGVAGWTEQ